MKTRCLSSPDTRSVPALRWGLTAAAWAVFCALCAGSVQSTQNARITSFTAARSTITSGSSTTLLPTYVNATGASINRGVGTVTSGAHYAVKPVSTTIYTLTVNGPGGPVTATATVTVVPAASIVAFTASPAAIVSGASSRLTATFSGGTATIDHGIGSIRTAIPVSTGPLAAGTTYTLSVTNAAGDTVTRTATVTVSPRVSITSFTAARSTITTGGSTTLTPTYVNATSASVGNGVGTVTSGAHYAVKPVSTTTYTLTVNGPGGPVTATATVTVVPAASIIAFTASPASIVSGASSQLTAFFSGGTAAIDHGIGSIRTAAPISTGPLIASTTYTLTVTNAAGDSVTRTTAVTVIPRVSITSFTAARSTITAGSSTTLTAIYVNATSASLGNGGASVTLGVPYTVKPVSTTTYILTVNGPGGPVTATATVTVVPAAGIAAFIASPASITSGASSQLTATFSGGAATIDHGIGSITTAVPVSTGPLTTSTTYTLTVTNAAGDSATRTTTVIVNAAPPVIVFGSAAYTFTMGTAIAPLTPTNTGGPVVSWSISPPLPAGLSFNTANGGITGAPTAVTPAAGYTVTATNSGGSSSGRSPSLSTLPHRLSATAAPPTRSRWGRPSLL